MKILDLYIIRKFLTTFFFIVGLVMVIAIIFDISEKIDDFIQNKAPLSTIVFKYYVNFVLFYGNLFSALLTFITVIFFTAQMAYNTEIVAILSSGISYRRLLFPYFISATILAAGSLYFNHWLIPEANKTRLEFENKYIRYPYRNTENNIHKITGPGENVYFESYNNTLNRGYRFSLEKWEGNTLVYKLWASGIQWDSTIGKWRLDDHLVRTISGLKEHYERGGAMEIGLKLHPKDFEKRLTNIEMMNYTELNNFIDEEKKQGAEFVEHYEVEKYQRTSYPFASYILTLIGVSIASRRVRGGIGLHIAFGLLICVSYILCMKVTTVFATNAGLNPLIAVWIANVLFGIISVYLFLKSPK